jgi:hypothetical protein
MKTKAGKMPAIQNYVTNIYPHSMGSEAAHGIGKIACIWTGECV